MSTHKITPHPTIDRHWFVNGTLVAGGTSPKEVEEIYQQAKNPVAADPEPLADDVRAEAVRRMIALLSARDSVHLNILISNGLREAIRLLRKGSKNWTEVEVAKSLVLEKEDMAIEAIRAASNRLENNPPLDYRDDELWP